MEDLQFPKFLKILEFVIAAVKIQLENEMHVVFHSDLCDDLRKPAQKKTDFMMSLI